MFETYGIEPHRASVTILADIEYAPAITWPGFVWLLVLPLITVLGGVVIFTFTVAVAAFRDVVDNRRTPLEVVGLMAIGIVLACVFYYALREVLGHTESGWGALWLAFGVALGASLLVLIYAWLANSNYRFTILGIVIVAAISWAGVRCRLNWGTPVAPAYGASNALRTETTTILTESGATRTATLTARNLDLRGCRHCPRLHDKSVRMPQVS
ncbi:hypothetical protein, partial [Mycolicibacterium sp.]|uniref:hypothetical protein n=1 Tax=Mycolicibacterium sp. TaxID=2320850 RepID=UPI0037C8E3E2